MLQTSIIGNLGADAEVKNINGNEFVSFNVAHTERWKTEDGVQHEKTLWVSCALSGNGGNILPFLKKGTTIFAIGRTSTRVYSSEKERGFVAGLNLSVQHIELIGGRQDEVPSRLYDSAGREVIITKWFYCADESIRNTILYDRSGNQYDINERGWAARLTNTNQEMADAPFTDGTTEVTPKQKKENKK